MVIADIDVAVRLCQILNVDFFTAKNQMDSENSVILSVRPFESFLKDTGQAEKV